MKHHMKQGWRLTVKHMHILIVLFLYQLLWGFFLYRYVDSVVTPLLERYPGTLPSESASGLFWAEAQFRLLKTSLVQPYAWTLLGMLALRMIVTPLLNAGLFYSLHHVSAGGDGGSRFMQGIRRCWKRVLPLYWCETLLTLAPAWWLLPRGLDALLSSPSMLELAQTALPWGAGWLLWGVLLHLLFLALQFGAASGQSLTDSLLRAPRLLLPLAALSLVLWLIAAASGLAVSGASLLWAGLLAIMIQQLYHFGRTLLGIWSVASQFDCWQSNQPGSR
ncbi:hypothetical protein [Paenibacillus beijingensis]|uniref:Uncharacterized protein n=1 Tax=Paenibacillus beijingensis TaxID=1126833 RepID=A0A0D5NJ17_9BACL|nr:hypothetical protein [Paenibacillus beijingensis]AJY74987.1 hypothetical protein VN24_10830 [Paenibacillus beijingensis]